MSDLLDTFGRVCMAEFIGALVQELPALPDGTPALTLFPNVFYRGADAVPVGYGTVLAKKVWHILRSRFWTPEIIEEAMLTFVTTAVRRKVYLTPGSNYCWARRYVIKSALNAARNVVRTWRRRRRGEVPLESEPDDDGPRWELADPVSLDEHDRVAFEVEVRLVLGDVNRLDRFSSPVRHAGGDTYSRSEIRRALKELRPRADSASIYSVADGRTNVPKSDRYQRRRLKLSLSATSAMARAARRGRQGHRASSSSTWRG